MSKSFVFAVLSALIFTGCNFQTNPDPEEPQYDIKPMRMIMELAVLTHASGVNFGSSAFYSSKDDYDKWLKLSLTNPVIKDDEELFMKKMAFYMIMHLKNRDKFEKIEVVITNRQGGVVNFSRSVNNFFYIDSLCRDVNTAGLDTTIKGHSPE